MGAPCEGEKSPPNLLFGVQPRTAASTPFEKADVFETHPKELGMAGVIEFSSQGLTAPLHNIKVRYTDTNAETTAGGFDSPVGDSVKLSGNNLAAFFAPRFPFNGRSGRGDAARYLARVASGLSTRPDTAHHRLTAIGRFVKRTERRRAMAAKAKLLAAPTQTFFPRFKRGDVCKLRKFKPIPELNGFVVTLLSNIQIVQGFDAPHKWWLGYETDLCYRGRWIFPSEDQLIKIGEVEL
ncbi:hypothetical protein ICN10_01690 [Polynucleobacter sp. 86C-FISCH]|uniref:hypothetical protein n=1 Tax=Polynucleobacter sp. 86C-FISCH TaxID=2689101 RepID=UPI001C0BAC3F|nr:hypothetical protein [Polynucleobacter sp. 86C-FISCH]MBU3595109.1 hypothetical protein [Polynucleobacter sp. 86C-FISCH]